MSKTILITGASSGIGMASTKLFAKNGWNVIATMRSPDESLSAHNVQVSMLDVQDESSISHAVNAGIARFGSIDVLLNNAGFGQYGLFEALSKQEIQAQFDVNVFGVMNVTRAILPHFRARKSGVIVNVGSGAGIFTLPMISLYCASKFALEGFTESLSYELAALGIVVKLVDPHGGVTSTRFSEKSAQSVGSSDSLSDYDAFISQTNKAFANMTDARTISSEEVASVIYDAVTDGTTRLRYLVGNDVRGFINARQNLGDQEYVDFMRACFQLK